VQPQADPHTRPTAETLPAQGFLGRFADDLADLLAVDRVTVAMTDPARPDTGVIAACLGAPGVLGRHVPLPTEPATGYKSADEAVALGLGEDGRELPWSYAHVPIAASGELLGAVTVVSRRPRAFSERELVGVERLARRRVPEFDRRRFRRTWRETV
jgi:GAF domain-containing protein